MSKYLGVVRYIEIHYYVQHERHGVTMKSVQHFDTVSDFSPPFHSEEEIPPYLINFLLATDGPPVSERSYVERFLVAISKARISIRDDIALTVGIDRPHRNITAALPQDLINHYRNLLDAVIEKPERGNAIVCMDLALQIKGKVMKIPTPDVTKDGFKMTERVAVTHRLAALAYANLLLLSKYKNDLCKCGYCNKYFLAKSTGRGRTSRVYCGRKHLLEHRAATSAERTDAVRAGVTWEEWRNIKTQHPGITPGKWEKIEKARVSRRHK
jgi:hypothetical protein